MEEIWKIQEREKIYPSKGGSYYLKVRSGPYIFINTKGWWENAYDNKTEFILETAEDQTTIYMKTSGGSIHRSTFEGELGVWKDYPALCFNVEPIKNASGYFNLYSVKDQQFVFFSDGKYRIASLKDKVEFSWEKK